MGLLGYLKGNKMKNISETTTIAYVYRDKDGNFLGYSHVSAEEPLCFSGVATTFDSHEAKNMDKSIKELKIKCKKQKVKVTHTVVLVDDNG
jgi:hypothetical protein